jgi:hypothetical protein
MAVNYVYLALLVGCCGYAFWRGGAPERIGAALYAGASVLTRIATSASGLHFRSIEIGVLTIDTLLVLAFLVLALRAERFWPIWVTALQAIGVIGHAAKLASPGVIPWAYAFVLSIWSYPILLLLCIGTYRHQQRLKRSGVDKSWTSSSPSYPPKTPPFGPPA